MRNVRHLSFVFILFLFASTAAAFAGDLEVHLSLPCYYGQGDCLLIPNVDQPGSPAVAEATFGGTPWAYYSQTPAPYHWTEDHYGYHGTFGPGGEFNLTGPDGLTMQAQIVNGMVYDNGVGCTITLNFAGKWSNGLSATGNTTIDESCMESHGYVTLDVTTVPEPTSLALLGSGIVTICGAYRRFRV